MPGISIPALQSSGGAAADYNTIVDSKYNTYNMRVAAFNVADAFEKGADTSQAKWGVMNLPARKGQNDIFYGQESINLITGNGALSASSITYPFTTNIKSVDSGQIRASVLFQNELLGTSFNINDTTKLLENGNGTTGDFDHTILHSQFSSVKSWILTHSATDYFCILVGTVIHIYNMDVNGTPNNLVTTFNAGRYGSIIVKGNHIWMTQVDRPSDRATIYCALYEFNGTTITNLGTSQIAQNNNGINSGQPIQSRSIGALKGNKGYFFMSTYKSTSSDQYNKAVYYTVDLTDVTGTPTTTIKYNANSSYWAEVGKYGLQFTGFVDYITDDLYIQNGTNITKINTTLTSGFDTGDFSVNSTNMIFNVDNINDLNNSLSNSLQVPLSSNLKYKGVEIVGTVVNQDSKISISEVYKEDVFQRYVGSNVVTGGTVNLEMSGEIIYSGSFPGFALNQFLNISIPSTVLNSSGVNFKLSCNETTGTTYGVGFGITGGNYAAPTGPSKSGLTQGSTEWTAGGVDSSYIDLTF